MKRFNHSVKVLMPTIGVAPYLYGFFRLEEYAGIFVPCFIDPNTITGSSPPNSVLMRLDDVAHASASESIGWNEAHVQSVLIRKQLRATEE
jgi:hypothetical protein